jgi:Co/Zn/Cd efflux system component
MFAVELTGAWAAGSVSLLADVLDFFGDAVNHGLSLAMLGLTAATRAKAALFKGLSMAALGAFVLGKAAWAALGGRVPEPLTMGLIGALALLANVAD